MANPDPQVAQPNMKRRFVQMCRGRLYAFAFNAHGPSSYVLESGIGSSFLPRVRHFKFRGKKNIFLNMYLLQYLKVESAPHSCSPLQECAPLYRFSGMEGKYLGTQVHVVKEHYRQVKQNKRETEKGKRRATISRALDVPRSRS